METKTGHTPGPWTISTQRPDHPGILVLGDSKNVCQTFHDPETPESVQESEADAALIAAAPELLAALYDAVAALEEREQDENGEAALNTCRAAIAKAK